MSSRGTGETHPLTHRTGPRVGLFGLLGSGNLGNDGSADALLAFLRDERPDATLSIFCAGPARMKARYGLPVTKLYWYPPGERSYALPARLPLKLLGKGFDAVRTVAWVRKQDVVIVPGMGVLEASVPLRPWGFPYALLVLCVSGRMLGKRVALLGAGAEVIPQRSLRMPITWAAKCAHLRSYRDSYSREAMRRMGIDTSGDSVHPDLTFALPVPEVPVTRGTVGLGLMAYRGGNDDRAHADRIHAEYLVKIKYFVRWLLGNGRQIRLLTGDEVDESVVAEIIDDARANRPNIEPSRIIAESAHTLDELMRQMASVEIVVATRYHNVLCALRLAKPTLSIGYADKNEVLMTSMGLAGFSQSVRTFDVDRLIAQFISLENRRDQVVEDLTERNRAHSRSLQEHLTSLSSTLLPVSGAAQGSASSREGG